MPPLFPSGGQLMAFLAGAVILGGLFVAALRLLAWGLS
jgi:hypothetical protein